ncbi:S8 family peptidase [Longispora albida]|uniref:S8 family peptidase n=1 Tax=Longispora albida TaxID=203523 RepID=UPI00036976F5|nr:S8 family peptidase [Longispora albida]
MSKKKTAALALPLAALTAFALGGSSPALADPVEAGDFSPGLYIVQLDDKPLASYTGELPGLAATKPADGAKLDARSPQAREYIAHLGKQRDSVAKSAGVKQEVTYDTAFNGFAAKLTGAQAAKLTKTPGVANVIKNEVRTLDTFSTPDFLGLTGKGGAWEKQFGGQGKAGEGVIIGVVDSGFAPENPSFGPLSEPRPDAADISAQWKAGAVSGNTDTRDNTIVCDPGTDAPAKAAAVTCNNKVLGARWYRTGITQIPDEFDSPRDYTSHGSHTASTAGGNANVTATAAGGHTYGKISGMAPAARLAIYKVCWAIDYVGGNSCGNVDSVKAIDQAVLDGVDVINYSISGSRTSVVDPVELAFLNAAQAGVFVAASAGNSGDTVGVSSVAHNSPWVTTVAASTHDRAFRKTVTLGNGVTYTGQGLGAAVPNSDLVDSVNVGLAGKNPTEVELCYPGNLDPAKVTGKIVLCKRGVNSRTDKSLAVQQAGGVGMVLYNPTANSLAADLHAVPTVHVNNVEGAAIKAYLATGTPKASLSAGVQFSNRAPEMAGFSSYGPALAGGGSLLKPDITAPGVDIVAAVASAGTTPQWSSMQGTSMSSPHIAGLAALIKSAHQNWGPMTIKSALMTTASQTDNNGKPIQALGKDATPLNFGAGHVVPTKAFDPGLVYESGLEDWLSYICALGQKPAADVMALDCSDFPKVDASDLNQPSIAIGGLGGSQTITRTVKNVSDKTGMYTAQVQAPAGTTVTVTPSRLVVAPGKTATFKVKITWNGAAFGKYTFGSLTWNDQRGHLVRSPIAVRPLGLVAPGEITVEGTDGSAELALKSGFTGTLNTTVTGLTASTVNDLNLKVGTHSFDTDHPATSEFVGSVEVTVPAGSTYARVATFNSDYAAGTDIDLYAYKKNADGSLTPAGSSGGGSSDEVINLPSTGTFVVFVDLFSAASGTEVAIKHHSWVLSADAGNLAVSPATRPVTAAGTYTSTAAWSGLEAGKHYLGEIRYNDGTTVIGRTVVGVHA